VLPSAAAMGWLKPTRSLLITGLADVWSAVREGPRRPGDGFGLQLMVVSAAAFALMAAFAKWLLPDTPTQAVVFSRGVLMTTVFVAAARLQRVRILGTRPGLLLLRGLLGYAALSCYFWSVQHLPLGDAVLLQYSHPVFVAAIAPLLLPEPTGRWHWPLVLAALAGVGMIVGPSGTLRGPALVGLGGAAFSGLAYLTVRRLSRTEHPLTILVWFPAASVPPSLVAAIHAGRASLPHSPREVIGHLAVFSAAIVGQFTLTHGLVRAGAARATAVTMTGPVFGLLFGWLIFGTRPGAWSVVGTALVMGAIILLASGHRS
jgi:drug/metabolite transporter (DMT)-like permease